MRRREKMQYEGGSRRRNCAKKCLQKVGPRIKKFKHSMVYNQAILFVLEAVLQITMAGMLGWFKPKVPGINSGDEFTESFLKGTEYSCLMMVVILLCLAFRLMLKSHEDLQHSVSNKRFGVLYEQLNTTKKSALFFNVVFIYRRIVVCFVYLFLVN
jgi:hypothetical protein